MESSNKTTKQAFVYCSVTEGSLNVLERNLNLLLVAKTIKVTLTLIN